MKCPTCGAEVKGTEEKCFYCGLQLRQQVPAPSGPSLAALRNTASHRRKSHAGAIVAASFGAIAVVFVVVLVCSMSRSVRPTTVSGSRPASPPVPDRAELERQPSTVPQTASDAGMCPASATRYLTEDDLSGRTAWQLTIMRNEIYARHGRPFVVDYIREYFQSQSWYRADPSYTDTRLNSVEERNAGFILDYQNRHNLRYERGQDRLGEG